MPTAPPADAPQKAKSPTQIRKQTWAYVLRRTGHEFRQDHCIDAAAGLTFFAVLSVFPALLAIVASVGLFGDGTAVVDRFLALLEKVAPGPVGETLREPLTEIAGSSAAGFAFFVGIAAALWSASSYVSAFGRAMNRIYEVDEGRPYWKRKPAQLAVTVALIVLVMIVGGAVILSGALARAVGEALDLGGAVITTWEIARWPLLAAAVVMMIALLYRTTSNLQQPRFRWVTLGALLAIVVLGVASLGFAVYIANFADYNQTFGTLAGVVIFLIWLFLVNIALLLGAEFNAELERGRQLQAGIQAEDQLRLPPRDTTQSRRTQRTARIDQEHGALLRQGEPLPDRPDTLIARLRRAVTRVRERLTRSN